MSSGLTKKKIDSLIDSGLLSFAEMVRWAGIRAGQQPVN
jgi:hypothetical protein